MSTKISLKSLFYLFLSLVGGAWTYFYTIKGIMANHGHFSALDFVQSTWTDNFYARSLTLDFWTGTIAGTFFILVEGMKLKMKRIWLYLILTFFIAYAFGFPLFLFARELHLAKQKQVS